MSSRVYCGADVSLISQYVVDDDIVIYGDSTNSIVNRELMLAISSYRSSIHSIVLEEVTSIGANTFRGLNSLSNITIQLGEDLLSIGDYAFADNTAFREITIPNNVTALGVGVFSGCSSLNTCIFEEPCQITVLPTGTFSNCGDLNKVKSTSTTATDTIEFPSSITTIEQYAFNSCPSLTGKLIIHDAITNIKSYAFYNCGSLTSITFGSSLNTGSSSSSNTTLQPPKNLFLASQRQFRYQHFEITASSDPNILSLNDEFKYCPYESHYMVFKNHLLLPQGSVYAHSINDTPLYRPELYCNFVLETGDIIDVFYITNELSKINSNVSNLTNVSTSEEYIYNAAPKSGYIRFVSPLYEVTSRNSLFVFMDGKKIPKTDMEDISDTIIKVTAGGSYPAPIEIYSHMNNITDNKFIYIKDGLSHEKSKIKSINISQVMSYERPCKLDELLNSSSDTQLNTLFNTTNQMPDITSSYIDSDNNMTRAQLLQMIFDDYSISGDSDWTVNI